MLRKISGSTMGHTKLHWLESCHHFSFSQYYNPDNTQFGVLRVLNDETVAPGAGYSTHPHNNMEMLTYVVQGEKTHNDSLGNSKTLTKGQVQYMCAGSGIKHSEYNHGSEPLRYLQLWIFPDRENCHPHYVDQPFLWEERTGIWLPIAARSNYPDFPIHLHADVRIYATLIPAGESLAFSVAAGRQAYLVDIEGEASVNGISSEPQDALEIVEETIVVQAADQPAHILLVEMKKS